MTTLSLPKTGDIVAIPLLETRQVTGDLAGGASVVVPMPFKGIVMGAVGVCAAIGGDTDPTDVDLTIQNADNSDANMLAGVIPVVNSSAIVRDTNVSVGPSATIASRRFNALDKVELVVDVTGGSNPTADGVGAYLLVMREE